MMRLVRTLPRLVLVVPFLFVGTTVSAYESAPSGQIEFASTSIGTGIGVERGGGKLSLNDGTEYSFSMNGRKIADVGVAEINAVGEVYNLYDVSDHGGYYGGRHRYSYGYHRYGDYPYRYGGYYGGHHRYSYGRHRYGYRYRYGGHHGGLVDGLLSIPGAVVGSLFGYHRSPYGHRR